MPKYRRHEVTANLPQVIDSFDTAMSPEEDCRIFSRKHEEKYWNDGSCREGSKTNSDHHRTTKHLVDKDKVIVA